MKIETKAVHAGRKVDEETGALAPPIHLSTTFEREPDGTYPTGFEYSRDGNPNRNQLEACIASLEEGSTAAAFASGSAAAMAVFQALSPGDHIVAPEDLYYGVRQMLNNLFVPSGIEVSFVDMTNPEAVKQAVRAGTRLIFAETPSNPLIRITDIRSVAAIARKAGAYFICDNTMATPALQQPLALGADLVIHSATKYLGGHSDIMCGLVVTKDDNELFQKIRMIQKIGGSIPSPFTCWLALRGIQTLPYRMRAHSDNAMKIAEFLNGHSRVESVSYPGLKEHAGHEIAREQMTEFGGMISFLVKGERAQTMAVAANVTVFTRATSFGGTHSLIEHRASVEGPGTKTPDNLLRLSIGLEHVDDLTSDLAQALK